jgi:hypothetical protein
MVSEKPLAMLETNVDHMDQAFQTLIKKVTDTGFGRVIKIPFTTSQYP